MASGKAILISFEGIDGSGKTTASASFFHYLTEQGIQARLFREPGATELGEWVREKLLLQGEHFDPYAELFLYLAARAQLCKEKISSELYKTQVIILDRFLDSTLAYQGYGRGLSVPFIKKAHSLIVGSLCPDITFLLDVSARTVRAVWRKRSPDHFEKSVAFQNRVREGYLIIAEEEPERVKIIKRASIHATLSHIIKVWERYLDDSGKNRTLFSGKRAP